MNKAAPRDDNQRKLVVANVWRWTAGATAAEKRPFAPPLPQVSRNTTHSELYAHSLCVLFHLDQTVASPSRLSSLYTF